MEKVRPGTGRETGLGRAGVRAPKVGALGDAWSSCRKDAEKCFKDVLMKTVIHTKAGMNYSDVP
jgi:hypothetical protein